jgi:hypothetical protein
VLRTSLCDRNNVISDRRGRDPSLGFAHAAERLVIQQLLTQLAMLPAVAAGSGRCVARLSGSIAKLTSLRC